MTLIFLVACSRFFPFDSKRATRGFRARTRSAIFSLVAALVLIGAASFAEGQTAHFDGAQALYLNSCYIPSGFCFGNSVWAIAVDAAGDIAFTSQNAEAELLSSPQAEDRFTDAPAALSSSGSSHFLDGQGNAAAQPVNASSCTNLGSGNSLYLWLASTKTLYSVNGTLGALVDPTGLTFDPSGNLYVLDASSNAIYKFLGTSGSIQVESVYGSGATINGPYMAAQMPGSGCSAGDMTMDSSGNLYYTELSENAVEEIEAVNGVIPSSPTTISLGSGFDVPVGIAVDHSGDVYVANASSNGVEEMLAVNGSIPASPVTRTLLGGFNLPVGLALDSRGDLYVADDGNNTLKEMAAVGGSIPTSPTIVSLGTYSGVAAVTLDGSGDIFIGGTAALFEYSASGANFGSVNAGTTSAAIPMLFTFDTAGTLGGVSVLTQGAPGLDYANAGTGTCAGNTAYFVGQSCTVNVTFTPKFSGSRYGAVVLTDSTANVIATGYLQGTGVGPQVDFAPGTESGITVTGNSAPIAVAIDAVRNLFVLDNRNNIAVKETFSAGSYAQTTIATGLSDPQAVAVDGAGNVYIADMANSRVLKETPTATAYVQSIVDSGGLLNPYGIAVDGSGNVFVADCENNRILKETPSTSGYTRTIVVSGLSNPLGVAVDGSSNLYVVDANNGSGTLLKETFSNGTYSQSTIPLTGGFAAQSIAVDGNGNVYLNGLGGYNIVKETPTANGYVESTLVSDLQIPAGPWGVAVDANGNLYTGYPPLNEVVRVDFADAPSLTFDNTAVGSVSDDSPQTVTVENNGNASLTFPIPTAGNNPTISTSFTLDSNADSDCPLLTANSLTLGTLAAATSCLLPISFSPTTEGILSGGSLVLTDSNLNAVAPNYSTQVISLSGTAEAPAGAKMLSPTPSSTLFAASTTFTWSNTPAGASAYYLWVGTTPGGSDVVNAGPFTGTSATVNLPTNGTTIYVRLWTFFNGYATQLYNDYTYTEATPSSGVITSPMPGGTLTSPSTTFNWSAATGGTIQYYLWVGTTPGGSDLANQGPFTGTSDKVNLPTNGGTIYVRLWTYVNGGAMIYHNDYTYTEATPSSGVITSPTPGSALTSASTTFNWSAASGGTIQYYLWVGSSPGGSDLANTGPFTGTSAMVNLPTNGTTIYVRLWTFVNGGAMQYHNDYTYTEATVAGGVITSPVPGGSLTTATTTFNWSAASGGTANYYLWIGTTPGGNDLVNQGPFTGTSATVNLPTNGTAIYVRLWTFLNGEATQLANDYSYTEATVAGGAITSPTPGSTLTSASTTFNWSAGSGGTIQYYLWVGSTAGGSDLVNTGPFTGTSATVNLPTNGAAIYVRLWTFINGGAKQLENDYTYTESTVAAGAITSPTPGGTLTSGTTTFNWSAGSGGTIQYYLWVGSTAGGSDLVNEGPLTGTSATVNLPTNGATISVRLWTFINGGAKQLENDYSYTEASEGP